MNSEMLSDITRGIHHAVNSTGSMISQQYVMLLQQFFDSEADGSIAAKMVKLKVDEQHDMLVPLIALVQPQGIALDKMRFDFSVKITECELKKATHEVDGLNLKRCAFKVNLSPSDSNNQRRQSDIVDIAMEFSRCDPPEGIQRLIDHYNAMIQPFKPKPTQADNPRHAHSNTDPSDNLQQSVQTDRSLNIVPMNTAATDDLPKEE